jgi:hypothetical protein
MSLHLGVRTLDDSTALAHFSVSRIVRARASPTRHAKDSRDIESQRSRLWFAMARVQRSDRLRGPMQSKVP